MEVSVEVRSQGAPVTGVAVELALHQEGNLLTAAHGVTNDAGIDFLSIDTSALASGVGYWLDINIGGVYLTGQSIVAGSGDCGVPKSIHTTGTISVVPGTAATGSDSARSGLTGTGAEAKVVVPAYQQQRNLSCEFASLYIATSAFGNGISEYTFDTVVGLSPNPHLGYRGNITGTWATPSTTVCTRSRSPGRWPSSAT